MNLGRTISKQGAGFTLIELMIVVALIGILSAMIIPEMRGTFQDALLRSNSRDLINTIDLAYSRAVSLNQIRRLHLQVATGRYQVEKQILNEGEAKFVPVDEPGCAGEINAKITMTFHLANAVPTGEVGPAGSSPSASPESDADAGATISFYPDGTADPGVIELADHDGFRLALQINPVTARIHLKELSRK